MKTQTQPRLKNRTFISGKERVGSVHNYLMGNNNTLPQVGEGATELLWTDRNAYDVTFVSEDGKQCKIRACNAIRTDKNGYFTESQDYKYEPNLEANEQLLVYRNGSWRKVVEQILWTQEALQLSGDERQKYIGENTTNLTEVIDGITYLKRSYPKINIIFGTRREYRDPSF